MSSGLWLDPLLALILLLAFQVVVKRPLLALAPSGLAARLPTPSLRMPSTAVLLWTVVSAVIGALTHVLWDSFTHYDGYFVRRYHSFFAAQVTGAWDVNRILQYVSTVGGCLVLAVWLYRWYRRVDARPVATHDHIPSWVRYVVLAAMVLIGLAGAVVQLSRADLVGEAAARSVLTGVASGCLAALAWYVVLWHLFRLRSRVAAL
ncbi:DUF4184 family protein [Kribbella sp. NPDC050281]|uniref:DUF4184 family protein n=1 Tax=Kribbella sp. NPDC050281 TaxID=3155515 RepID=UPI0033EAD107